MDFFGVSVGFSTDLICFFLSALALSRSSQALRALSCPCSFPSLTPTHPPATSGIARSLALSPKISLTHCSARLFSGGLLLLWPEGSHRPHCNGRAVRLSTSLSCFLSPLPARPAMRRASAALVVLFQHLGKECAACPPAAPPRLLPLLGLVGVVLRRLLEEWRSHIAALQLIY